MPKLSDGRKLMTGKKPSVDASLRIVNTPRLEIFGRLSRPFLEESQFFKLRTWQVSCKENTRFNEDRIPSREMGSSVCPEMESQSENSGVRDDE